MEIAANVIVGKNDDLFLSSDRHFTLDLMLGKKAISERSIENFENNLRRRRRLSEAQKAKYLHLVAPDKHVVMRENFPLEEFIALGEVYRQKTGVDFLYPVELLQKNERRCYSLTDTHWNVRGQIFIAGLLASSLGYSAEEVAAGRDMMEKTISPKKEPFIGDLGEKLTPNQSEPAEEFRPSWRVRAFSNGVRSGNDGRLIVNISSSPVARGRLVVFGDSFLAQTLSAMTAYFKEIIFCRTRYFHHEIIIGARPDFVVSENVERYLSHVTSDMEAVPMLLMAEMNGRLPSYAPGHAAAIGAMLSGKNRTYKNFIAGLDAATVEKS